MSMECKYQLAEFTLRIFAGVLFLFQGYDKLFRVRLSGVTNAFMYDANKRRISRGLVHLMSIFTSLAEFLGGLLLLLGLFKTIALSFLGLDLILVALAFSFMEPMWDMKHVFPRLALIIALLLIPVERPLLSLDTLIKNF